MIIINVVFATLARRMRNLCFVFGVLSNFSLIFARISNIFQILLIRMRFFVGSSSSRLSKKILVSKINNTAPTNGNRNRVQANLAHFRTVFGGLVLGVEPL